MRFLLNAMQWRVDITGHAWRRYWTEPEDVFNSIGQRPRSYEDTLSNPQNGPGTEKRYAQESRRRFHAIVQDDMSVVLDRQKRPIDFRGDRGTRRSPEQPKKHQPIYLSRPRRPGDNKLYIAITEQDLLLQFPPARPTSGPPCSQSRPPRPWRPGR
jgi:hypothetical protein